jgi:simple sugar transport system ATP-binding protein
MAEPFLELRNIHKHFSGVHALNDVSLSIRPGEIHCLAGENGSGKSTLIKVIAGVYPPDAGIIEINGKSFAKLTPIESLEQGIQVIYQDFSLFRNLTVAENLALNSQLREGRKLINWRQVRRIAREALDRLGIDIDLSAELDSLPVSGKQLVAIAKALMFDARMIIMDEPTTALTGREVDRLFSIVRAIQCQNIAVLFVSHKMREMLEISERITIIRNGLKVAEGPTSEFNESTITTYMTGREHTCQRFTFAPPPAGTPPRLEVENLGVPGKLSGISFSLAPGEIVGVTGLLGSGRTCLALSLFGLTPKHTGRVLIDGRPVPLTSIQEAIAAGIAYVPEDRLTEGLFLSQSINRNLLAAVFERISRFLVIDKTRDAALASDMIRDLQIATPSGKNPVSSLSGGNQQRVVLGRWLLTNARLLVLNGPTVGVDVGSKAEIHAMVRALALEHGLGVVMISDDLPELVQNANRILVMHRGRLVNEIAAAQTDEDALSDLLKTLA